MKARLSIVLLFVAAQAQTAPCPISECNYLDPQYTAAFSEWTNCTTTTLNQYTHVMETLAAFHPKFGIVYRSMSEEVKAALHADGTFDQAAIVDSRRRFDDRILSTAEPEALEYYNLFKMKLDQQFNHCGPMPGPPRGQPQYGQSPPAGASPTIQEQQRAKAVDNRLTQETSK